MEKNIFNETFQKHLRLLSEKISSDQKDEIEKFDKKLSYKLSKIYEKDLPTFVQSFKILVKDPKVQKFLMSAKEDGDLTDDKIEISGPYYLPVKSLNATQNEVFLDKSIKWPMQNDATQIHSWILNGYVDSMPAIITSANKYIIDGHHRWSQAYCFNKNAKIKVFNINFDSNNVEDILKKIHIGIAASVKNVPLEDKGGESNLFKIQEAELNNWLLKNLPSNPNTLLMFKKQEVLDKMKSVLNVVSEQISENLQDVLTIKNILGDYYDSIMNQYFSLETNTFKKLGVLSEITNDIIGKTREKIKTPLAKKIIDDLKPKNPKNPNDIQKIQDIKNKIGFGKPYFNAFLNLLSVSVNPNLQSKPKPVGDKNEISSDSDYTNIIFPYLWSNVKSLQTETEQGKYSRSIMPQTEKDSDIKTFISTLKTGNVNVDWANETFQKHITLLHEKLNSN